MLERLLKNLNSRKAAVREAALQEARALPPEQLLQLVERQAEMCRLRRRRIRVLGLNISVVMLLWWSLLFLADFHVSLRLMKIIQLVMVAILIVFYNVENAYIRMGPSRAVRELLTLIEEKEDADFLLPALEFWYREGHIISLNLKQIILRLLPQLRAEKVNNWTIEQKEALLLPLKHPFANPDLTICLLHTLEQVGDASALPAVQKIAEMQGGLDKDPIALVKIRQAAQDCLPLLKIRAEQTGQAQMLLRASDAVPKAGPEVLLRPAAQNTDTILSEQLLRPTTTEE